jgi:hypothetical protein
LDLNNGVEDHTMLKTDSYDGWRPDKIIIPSNIVSCIKPISIRIVGKFSIPEFTQEDYTMVE